MEVSPGLACGIHNIKGDIIVTSDTKIPSKELKIKVGKCKLYTRLKLKGRLPRERPVRWANMFY